VGLAVVESRLEVVHLLLQAFHIFLNSFLVFCQADLDIGLWAGDKPRVDMSETVFTWLVGYASSHLSNTLVDIGVGWQTVELGSSKLKHAVLAVLAVHLGLDNDHLLLAELGLLLDFLQELDWGQLGLERLQWADEWTFCISAGDMDMTGECVLFVV
jgi:hypothetical protein